MFNDSIKATLKDAAKKLTGHRERDFMAKVAEDYFDGSAQKTETSQGSKASSPSKLTTVTVVPYRCAKRCIANLHTDFFVDSSSFFCLSVTFHE